MTIRIEIDGVPVSTDEDRILVDVAAEAGVYIPTSTKGDKLAREAITSTE